VRAGEIVTSPWVQFKNSIMPTAFVNTRCVIVPGNAARSHLGNSCRSVAFWPGDSKTLAAVVLRIVALDRRGASQSRLRLPGRCRRATVKVNVYRAGRRLQRRM